MTSIPQNEEIQVISDITSFKNMHDVFIGQLDGKKGIIVGCGPHAFWTVYYRKHNFIMTPLDSCDGVVFQEDVVHYVAPGVIPFREWEFDFAICSCIVQHLESWNEAMETINEIARVVRNFGNFLFIFKEGVHDTLVTMADDMYGNRERTFRVYDSDKVIKYLEEQWVISDVKKAIDKKRRLHCFIYARRRFPLKRSRLAIRCSLIF